MSVAPSFQKLELVGEPFAEGDKEYIYVRYPDGHTRKVRWYDEGPKRIRSVKEVLGFSKGYITIFKGDTYPLLEWFQAEPNCRYHNFWGWYCVSEDELPQVPAGITPVQLKWEDVAIVEEDCLKSEALVRQAVDATIYEPSASQPQGEVGERLDRTLTVKKVITQDGYYGASSFHIFTDENENVYTWNTSAKTLEVGKTYHIKGTVKDYTRFRGVNQTNLTRCMVCQDK